MRPLTWSIKEIVKVLKARVSNEFDGNIIVSGDRGNGKSHLICKLFYRFDGFKPWKHQVYNRDDVIKLLKTQEYGLCWDDEAINSGYKRNFQEKGQQELIKILTAYRDNYNIYASAIPNFFSLDKDLRDLCFMHIHVIERGIVVVHMPLQGRLYSSDKWDVKYNSKVEEKWSKRIQKDPNFKPPYHNLSTFRGYLFFEDITTNQKKLYKQIKKIKREQAFKTDQEKRSVKELSFVDKLYKQLIAEKLTMEFIKQACLLEGEKYSTINATLNRMLSDNATGKTVGAYLQESVNKSIHSKVQDQINQLIPLI